MNIVIGLGNPGTTYVRNRHNVGFMTLSVMAALEGLHFNERKLFHSEIASFGTELLLAKPTTFMNNSGLAAAMLVKQHNGLVVVVYDDIDIPLGEIKCSFGRGAGGHNGVQSVIDHLGTKDFLRIRIGVRPVHEELQSKILPPNGFETFLLSNFAPFEDELRDQGIGKAIKVIEALPFKSTQDIMNEYN